MATDCARLPPSQVINFGNALDSAARFVEAEEAYNLALNLVPSDASVHTSLAHRASLDCMQVLTTARLPPHRYTSLAHTAKSQGTHAGVLRAGGAGVITSDGPLITSDYV